MEKLSESSRLDELRWRFLEEIAANSLRGVREMIEKEKDHPGILSFKDGAGKTALHYAATAEMARELIKAGLDLNAKDHVGRTPVHMAVGEGNTDALQALVEAGADLSIQERSGFTAGHLAARWGRGECVRILLGGGWDPSRPEGKAGMTGAHMAAGCREASEEVLSELERCDLDWSQEDSRGRTPESIAKEAGGKAWAERVGRIPRAQREKEELDGRLESPSRKGAKAGL